MYARRILFWAVLLLGSLIAFIGALGLIYAVFASGQDATTRNNGLVGSIAFLAIGLAMSVPSGLALFRKARPQPLPPWLAAADQAASRVPSSPENLVDIPDAAVDGLRDSYLRWSAWCQSELGGDAIALHAGAMAALAASAAGSTDAGAAAARALVPNTGKTSTLAPDKLNNLADIGASTLLFLAAGERVLVSFRGADQRVAAFSQLAFGLIGRLLAARGPNMCFVTVTDRRVIVLMGSESTGRASSLRLTEARSRIRNGRYQRGLLGNGYFVIKSLEGPRIVMNVMRNWTLEVSVASALLRAGKSKPA